MACQYVRHVRAWRVAVKQRQAGWHDELLALRGTYAELFTLQASPYQ